MASRSQHLARIASFGRDWWDDGCAKTLRIRRAQARIAPSCRVTDPEIAGAHQNRFFASNRRFDGPHGVYRVVRSRLPLTLQASRDRSQHRGATVSMRLVLLFRSGADEQRRTTGSCTQAQVLHVARGSRRSSLV
jgi:hypothetical protein